MRLTGSVHPQQLSSLVAVDALLRRTLSLTGVEPTWEIATIAGDIATQHATQRAVVREGDNREELGRTAFALRAEALHVSAQEDLSSLLQALQVGASLDRWAAGTHDASYAAKVAFVRLYEEGLLRRSDAVNDNCPSCETVLDESEVDSFEAEVERIRLRLPLDSGSFEMELTEPELLVGAVALAVPADQAPAEATVFLPVLDEEVPIVLVEGLEVAELVVPGHFRWSYELARHLRLPIIEIMDGEGVLRCEGPLNGLGRYAARVAATEQLAAGGYLVAHFPSVEVSRKCHRCATSVVPLRGSNWLLSFDALTGSLTDAINDARISISPLGAAENVLQLAQASGSWCVSQQLWSGQPIPVYTCLDCNQTAVSVEEVTSCPSCMGGVQPAEEVLDARFVAAVTPLVMHGWPRAFDIESAQSSALSVGRSGLQTWALPMAVLALRLVGEVPFSQIIVHQFAIGAPEPGQRRSRDLLTLSQERGHRLIRTALLLGDFDIERAQEVLTCLEAPAVSTEDRQISDQFDEAISGFDAGQALSLLQAWARDGVSLADRGTYESMLSNLVGDT